MTKQKKEIDPNEICSDKSQFYYCDTLLRFTSWSWEGQNCRLLFIIRFALVHISMSAAVAHAIFFCEVEELGMAISVVILGWLGIAKGYPVIYWRERLLQIRKDISDLWSDEESQIAMKMHYTKFVTVKEIENFHPYCNPLHTHTQLLAAIAIVVLQLFLSEIPPGVYNKYMSHTYTAIRPYIAIFVVFRATILWGTFSDVLVILRPFVEMLIAHLRNEEVPYLHPILSWFPFPMDAHPNYEFIYLLEAHTVVMVMSFTSGGDGLLDISLSRIAVLVKGLAKKFDEPSLNVEHIRFIVKKHNAIFGIASSVESVFTWSLLLNLMCSSVIICFIGFQAILFEPIYNPIYKSCLLARIMELGTISYFADNVRSASLEIADAAFGSNWMECDKNTRTAILFLILRSQKPMEIRAGFYVVVNMVTFSSIISRAYSFLMMVITVVEPQ